MNILFNYRILPIYPLKYYLLYVYAIAIATHILLPIGFMIHCLIDTMKIQKLRNATPPSYLLMM